MDARIIDLAQISQLLAGGALNAKSVLKLAHNQYPEAWQIDPENEDVSVGAVLESLLATGQTKGRPHLAGRALLLLCKTLGESLDLTSFDDISMIHMFAMDALAGLPGSEKLYGRVPPPLKDWSPGYGAIGYVTPSEAASLLNSWPEPDYDDPTSEIYAAREQIESWLRKARDADKSLIVFWE